MIVLTYSQRRHNNLDFLQEGGNMILQTSLFLIPQVITIHITPSMWGIIFFLCQLKQTAVHADVTDMWIYIARPRKIKLPLFIFLLITKHDWLDNFAYSSSCLSLKSMLQVLHLQPVLLTDKHEDILYYLKALTHHCIQEYIQSFLLLLTLKLLLN